MQKGDALSPTSYNTTLVTSPSVSHSSRTSSFKSRSNDGSSSSSFRVNMCLSTTTRLFLFAEICVSSSVIAGPKLSSSTHSSNFLARHLVESYNDDKSERAYFCILPIRFVIFFLSTTLLGFASPPVLSFLCPNSARCTLIREGGPPSRSSASSKMLIARLTESSLKYTTSASPLNVPSSRAYILTLGSPSSSSSMSPHLLNRSTTSSNVASKGRRTKTAVFLDLRSESGASPLLAAFAPLPRFVDGPGCTIVGDV